MVNTRANTGGVIEYEGLTTNSLGRAPRNPATKKTTTSTTTSAATPRPTRGGRKAPRGRGRGRGGRARGGRGRAGRAAPTQRSATASPAADAASPVAVPAPAPASPAPATATTASVAIQCNLDCDNCQLLRRRVARRDATIQNMQALHEETLQTNHKLHNQRCKILSDTGAAGYHTMDLANAEIRRLGGTEVEMTAWDGDVVIWAPATTKPDSEAPAEEAGQADEAPAGEAEA